MEDLNTNDAESSGDSNKGCSDCSSSVISERLYEVRCSSVHNKGVFAKTRIPKGIFIMEYTGELISKEESERRLDIMDERRKSDMNLPATYTFEVNDVYDLDGDVPENDAKYINHSCDPNCEFEIIGTRIQINAHRDIEKGEELSFNYGFGFDDDYLEHPCLCGSSNCVGYILAEEDWPKLAEAKKRINNKYIEVKESSIHNKGVFAKTDIPKETMIMEYFGRKIPASEGSRIEKEYTKRYKQDPQNNAATYIFSLDNSWDLDGDIPNNDAKYINHSCDPNCEVDVKDGRIFIYAIRDIKKGEELLYNYGFEYAPDYFEHPCYCGSSNCAGYILAEEDWPKLKQENPSG